MSEKFNTVAPKDKQLDELRQGYQADVLPEGTMYLTDFLKQTGVDVRRLRNPLVEAETADTETTPVIPFGTTIKVGHYDEQIVASSDEFGQPEIDYSTALTMPLRVNYKSDKQFKKADGRFEEALSDLSAEDRNAYIRGAALFVSMFARSNETTEPEPIDTNINETNPGNYVRSRLERLGQGLVTLIDGGEKYKPRTPGVKARAKQLGHIALGTLRLTTVGAGLLSVGLNLASGSPQEKAAAATKEIAEGVGHDAAGTVLDYFHPTEQEEGVNINPDLSRIQGKNNYPSLAQDIDRIVASVKSQSEGVGHDLERDIQMEALSIALKDLAKALAIPALLTLGFRKKHGETSEYRQVDLAPGVIYTKHEVAGILDPARGKQAILALMMAGSLANLASAFPTQLDQAVGVLEGQVMEQASDALDSKYAKTEIDKFIDKLVDGLPDVARHAFKEELSEKLNSDSSDKASDLLMGLVMENINSDTQSLNPEDLIQMLTEQGAQLNVEDLDQISLILDGVKEIDDSHLEAVLATMIGDQASSQLDKGFRSYESPANPAEPTGNQAPRALAHIAAAMLPLAVAMLVARNLEKNNDSESTVTQIIAGPNARLEWELKDGARTAYYVTKVGNEEVRLPLQDDAIPGAIAEIVESTEINKTSHL